jgi:hypothetical protein
MPCIPLHIQSRNRLIGCDGYIVMFLFPLFLHDRLSMEHYIWRSSSFHNQTTRGKKKYKILDAYSIEYKSHQNYTNIEHDRERDAIQRRYFLHECTTARLHKCVHGSKSWHSSASRLTSCLPLSQSTSSTTIVLNRILPHTCHTVASLVRLHPWELVLVFTLSPALSQHRLRD